MSEAAEAPVEGRIDPERPIQTHLARALLPIVRAKRTGALQVVLPGAKSSRTQIVIVDGHIVFAESEPDAHAVLERLVAQGALQGPQALRIERRLLEERSWSGMVKASELAVSEAQVPPNVAMQTIAETVRARVSACLRAAEGEWAYKDDPRAGSVPRYAVPFEKTVLEALAHADCAPRFERALARYASHYPRLEGDKQESTTLFGMTPARFRTLRLLDGAHVLTDVLRESPMGATEAASFLAGLTMFERIWWNASPSPKVPTGAIAAQRAAQRPVTMERPPTAVEELRSLARPPTQAPSPRGPSQLRMPTPSTDSPGDARPTSKQNVPSAALVSELLRRGGVPRPSSSQATPAQKEALGARGHFDRGRAHLAAGRLAAATADLARASELEPNDVSYQLHARFALYVQGSGDREALAKELSKLASARARDAEGDAFAFHVLGRLAFDQGDDERARKAFGRAERLAPNDVETLRYQRILASRAKK